MAAKFKGRAEIVSRILFQDAMTRDSILNVSDRTTINSAGKPNRSLIRGLRVSTILPDAKSATSSKQVLFFKQLQNRPYSNTRDIIKCRSSGMHCVYSRRVYTRSSGMHCVYSRRLYKAIGCSQTGQMCLTSRNRFAQKGIRQHPKIPLQCTKYVLLI